MPVERPPLAAASRSVGVQIRPVTLTTDSGVRPARTRSSTMATAALPSSGPNSPSRQIGSRRVTQVLVVTFEISARCCTAEIPPPTTTTC